MIIIYSVTNTATGEVVFVGEDKHAERFEQYTKHEYSVYDGTRYVYEPPTDTWYKVVAAVPSGEGVYDVNILYQEKESDTELTLHEKRIQHGVMEEMPPGFVLHTFSDLRL